MNHTVLISIIFSFFLAISFTGAGFFILNRWALKTHPLNFVLNLSASFAIGFGLYALIYFGFYSIYDTPHLPLILLLQSPGFILFFMILKPFAIHVKGVYKLFSEQKPIKRVFVVLTLLGTIAFIICIGAYTLTPVKLGDAIIGYLETSRWIYHNGFKTFDPYNSRYSTMPVYTEIIYSLSFVLNTELVAKCLDAFFALFFVAGIYGVSRLFMGRILSLYAALSFFTLHQFWIYGGGKIDMEAQFIYFISMGLLLANIKELNFRLIVLSAFLLGISMGQKYTVLIMVPFYVISLIYILYHHKYSFRKISGIVLLCGATALLVFLPHLIKNYIWCGNPFAPFVTPLFKSRYVFGVHNNGELTFISWKDTLLFPYSIFIKNRISVVIFLGIVFLIIDRKRHKNTIPVFIFLIIQFLIWIAVFQEYWYNERFILSLLSFLLLFGYMGFQNWYRKYELVRVFLFLFVFGSLIYYTNYERRFLKYYQFIIGKQDEASWQDEFNDRAANTIRQINPQLNANQKMLILEGDALYYIPYNSLPYLSTELQALTLKDTSDKYAYLKRHNFKFLFYGLRNDPEAKDLPGWVDKNSLLIKSRDALIFQQ